MINFTVNRQLFQRILKGAKSLVKESNKNNYLLECQLSATSTICNLTLRGIEYSIPCKGSGAAIATYPFIPFLEIMKLETKENIEMKISETHVTIGTFSFPAKTNFFPNDRILRTIELPRQYTLIDLIKLTKSDYTQEELVYNQIPEKIKALEDGVTSAIKSCFNKLKKIGIQYKDVEDFVMSAVYK
jgi:hypothetical protein